MGRKKGFKNKGFRYFLWTIMGVFLMVSLVFATTTIRDSGTSTFGSNLDLGSNNLTAGTVNASNIGTVYTRWGREVCPTGATLVYSGYAAGSYYTQSGAGSNHLCLSSSPTWDAFNDTVSNPSLLYGSEYEITSPGMGLEALQDFDVPCAVCLVNTATISLMVPGTQICPSGFNLQYAGYIMSKHQTQSKSEYVCVDRAMTGISGSSANNNGDLFYVTEGACGSLPCLPYVAGREITCSVCTR